MLVFGRAPVIAALLSGGGYMLNILSFIRDSFWLRIKTKVVIILVLSLIMMNKWIMLTGQVPEAQNGIFKSDALLISSYTPIPHLQYALNDHIGLCL